MARCAGDEAAWQGAGKVCEGSSKVLRRRHGRSKPPAHRRLRTAATAAAHLLPFTFSPCAQLRYANNSNYKNDTMIRKECFVSQAVLDELRRIIEDSEVRPSCVLLERGACGVVCVCVCVEQSSGRWSQRILEDTAARHGGCGSGGRTVSLGWYGICRSPPRPGVAGLWEGWDHLAAKHLAPLSCRAGRAELT